MEDSNIRKRLFNVCEAAAFLGVRAYTIRRLVHVGELPRVDICRKLLIDIQDLEDYLNKQKRVAGC